MLERMDTHHLAKKRPQMCGCPILLSKLTGIFRHLPENSGMDRKNGHPLFIQEKATNKWVSNGSTNKWVSNGSLQPPQTF
jgi:hypothetical protein